jgi:polyhydroxybutyrate depolymerase
VDPKAWYAAIVCAAKQRRIVSGTGDGSFQPDRPVNVAEALRIVLRAQQIPIDAAVTDPWYAPYADYAHEHGIISKNSYVPWETLTRERMAQIIAGVRRSKEAPHGAPKGFVSSGCGQKPPSSPPTSVDVNGTLRQFILDVPRGYSQREATPLIVAFHGRTNSNAQVRQYMELGKYAGDFLVAYPSALKNGSAYNWDPSETGDYAFFDALVASLASQYCVDMDRIFVAGHSLGGWFANQVACARGSVVRGVASLGGSAPSGECTGPAAAMVLHNPHDNLAVFSGGEAARDRYLAQDLCDASSAKPTAPAEYKCVRYSCADGAPVVWCPFEKDTGWNGEYYPHVWPTGVAQWVIGFFKGL